MKKHPVDGGYDRARALRQNMTDAERSVWQILRSLQIDGHRFRRQVPFGPYIADFVCHDARLIIEIDGGQYDRLSPAEAKRARFLEDQGYRTCAFGTMRCCQTSKACVWRSPGTYGVTPTLSRPHQGGGNALTIRDRIRELSPRGASHAEAALC